MSHSTPKQSILAKALRAFPDKETQAAEVLSDAWPKGHNLYEALRALGDVRLKYHLQGELFDDTILNIPGRFMNSPISLLRKGEYYHLGINPGFDKTKKADHAPLLDEICEWSRKERRAYHAIVDECWGSDLQRNVLELCRAVGIKPRELCSSNFYFCRANKADEIHTAAKGKEDAFWNVHEAVMKIVEPKCIFVFSTAKDKYPKILELMGYKDDYELLPSDYDKKAQCKVACDTYQDRPTMLIGIPYPNHGRQLTHHPTVLKAIADKCHKFIADHP
jgi:hypothetical protein